MKLLTRYAPAGAGQQESASGWARWLEENRPYLFFSDQGDYRWYVDTLAKKRAIPTAELRGPKRASNPITTARRRY